MAVVMDQYLRSFKTGGLFCPRINIKKYQEFSTDLKKTEQKKDLKLFRLRYNAVISIFRSRILEVSTSVLTASTSGTTFITFSNSQVDVCVCGGGG